jgi:hypothetical protein
MTTRFRLLALAMLLTASSTAPAGAVWVGLSRDALTGRADAGMTVLQGFPASTSSCTDALWI